MASQPEEIQVEQVPARAERVRFCSRCGTLAEPGGQDRPGFRRVCTECGMGVYLTCAREGLGTLGTFFLVVNEDLRIGAVSEGAESIFGDERALVGAPLTRVLESPLGEERLRRAVCRAALGVRESLAVPIAAAADEARRFGPLVAKVSPCGPPRAALLAIEPSLS